MGPRRRLSTVTLRSAGAGPDNTVNQDTSVSGATLTMFGSRSNSHASSRDSRESTCSRRSVSPPGSIRPPSSLRPLYVCRTPGTANIGGNLRPSSHHPHNPPQNHPRNHQQNHPQDSFGAKYGVTIVAFFLAGVLATIAKKGGYNTDLTSPSNDIDYVKNQMEGVKLSVAQLHVAQQEIDDIYSQMNNMLGDFKDMADTLGIKHKGRRKTEKCEGGCDVSTPAEEVTALAERETQTHDKCEIEVDELIDYALESAGAYIISTENTENYREPNEVTFLGITICSKEKGPDTILQPSTVPGNCWAFKGQVGSVVIKLVQAIQITGITIDHISRKLSTFELDSAPREFSLHGINEELQAHKPNVFYGRFVYDIDSTASQYFSIEKATYPVDMVGLRVHTNYGNTEYTCIYRVRIHGVPDPTIDCDDEDGNC